MQADDGGSAGIEKTTQNKESALVFDYGERRIGVAFANRVTESTTSLTTIRARGDPASNPEIEALFNEWRPDAIVVGVPYNIDGGETRMSTRALEFAEKLGHRHGLPIDAIDERLTSAEAGMLLREQRRSGQRRRRVSKEDIDSLAAQLIAEQWLRDT